MEPVQPTPTDTPRPQDSRPILAGVRRARDVPVRFREQILYLAVGGWNTVFGYAVWALLQFLLGNRLHYLLIVLMAWPIAVLNAYLGYRYLVFNSRGPILRELPRFSLVYVAALAANLVLLPVALWLLPLNIYVVQALFMALVVIASYLAHKYFSFRGGQVRRTGPLPPEPTPASED